MKRFLIALVGVVALTSGSGCCALDRLWCHHWGMCPWGGCKSGGCDSCGGGCGAGGCESGDCGPGGCGVGHHDGHLLGHHHHKYRRPGQGHFATNEAAVAAAGAGGPPTGAVAYPYYTNRGPRDFLVDNPPSIGP